MVFTSVVQVGKSLLLEVTTCLIVSLEEDGTGTVFTGVLQEVPTVHATGNSCH